jgi:hypothetical protein
MFKKILGFPAFFKFRRFLISQRFAVFRAEATPRRQTRILAAAFAKTAPKTPNPFEANCPWTIFRKTDFFRLKNRRSFFICLFAIIRFAGSRNRISKIQTTGRRRGPKAALQAKL